MTTAQATDKVVDKRPPLRRWRVLHGQHVQDDPRFQHLNFKAPAGHPQSPFLAPTLGPDQKTVMVNPRVPMGDDDSPFHVDGTRKSVTYNSRIYQESMHQRFKLGPLPEDWNGDVFESRSNMLELDREKYALVTDQYMNESKQDRLSRLKREIAALEGEVIGEEQVDAQKAEKAVNDNLDAMTFEELKQHAGKHGIVLKGARTKEEALRLIREAMLQDVAAHH